MKKFLLLLGVFMMALAASAQVPIRLSNTANSDTLICSSSVDTVSKDISVSAGYSALGIQVNAKKISGTVNAKAYLYGSVDGTNFVLTDSSAAFNDADNVVQFTKTSTPYSRYRVHVRNSTGAATTQRVAVTVWYVARKHD